MAAVFWQFEFVPVGKPGQLGGELVALALGGVDAHGETAVEMAKDHSFEPSDMIDVGNDALADLLPTWASSGPHCRATC